MKELADQKAEDDREIAEIKEALAKEEEMLRRRLEDERLQRKEVLEYNARYNAVIKERQRVERLQDEYLIRYAMEKEAEEIAAENAKRNANKAAAAQYRKYLEEQMIKESEDNSALDEIRKREEEKVWNARDAMLDARQRARDDLRRMVDEGRREQIENRRKQELSEAEEDRQYAKQFIIAAKEGIQKERDEDRRRREINVENRSHLEEQMEMRRLAAERERQEIYLESLHMRHMERLHQQKLREQGGAVRLYRPLKQTQWYS